MDALGKDRLSLDLSVQDDGTFVLTLTGKLTESDLDIVYDTADQVLRHTPRLVVDLGGISSVDFKGIYALLMAQQSARRLGASLTLRSASPEVLELLQSSRMIRRFALE